MTFDSTSGRSVPHWLIDETAVTTTKLDSNIATDTCIIGGGIAGLSVAYHLIKEGRQVVVLEDGELLSGETGRTTAHLMSEVDDKYYEIERTFGLECAKLTYDSHSQAIDRIEQICRTENIDCDFQRLDGYLFAGPEGDESLLDKEYAAAKRAGFTDVELVDQMPISLTDKSLKTNRALKCPRQGQFHPVKYCNGLARAIVRGGGKIYTHTHASDIEGGDNARIVTSDGFTVSCKNIAVCTNVPVNDRVTMYTKMEPYRTYAISAKVKKGLLPYALWWDTADPYHYVRLCPDHTDPNYDILITGGEDHKTGQAHDFEGRFAKLEHWTRKLFPVMGAIESKWSGQVAEPVDMLAFIGRNPSDYSNVYICTGDSGTGMTHCTIAGMLITDLIMGRNNAWAQMYDPSRKPYHEKMHFIEAAVNANIQYKDYLTGGDIPDIEDLKPGCGAVIKDGIFHKVAVYKDDQGVVHKCSAICPHLKAIVNWNDYEKSWDCPAHGSRFDPYGHVINGPSNCDLSSPSKDTNA
jgi:glycine/D-amino acid oxidase-like deaminating enzyme/nitrite reductase/ring-hydroxylating ferredoxin subunit